MLPPSSDLQADDGMHAYNYGGASPAVFSAVAV